LALSSGLEIISMIRETVKIRPRSPPFQRLEGRLFCPVCGSPLQYVKAGNKRVLNALIQNAHLLEFSLLGSVNHVWFLKP